jgi:hypothetical protein
MVRQKLGSNFFKKRNSLLLHEVLTKINVSKSDACCCEIRVVFNVLKLSGCYMYHQFEIQKILRSAHTVCLGVLHGSQNKQ